MVSCLRIALFAAGLICLPVFGRADIADRIESILQKPTVGSDGEIAEPDWTASVADCAIRQVLHPKRACPAGSAVEYGTFTQHVDVRAFNTSQRGVLTHVFSANENPSAEAMVRISYSWGYDRVLRTASNQAARISEEEREGQVSDNDALLRALSERYRTEIDPRSFSMSFQETAYCSGVSVKQPLNGGSFGFSMTAGDVKEFISLVQELAATCEAIPDN